MPVHQTETDVTDRDVELMRAMVISGQAEEEHLVAFLERLIPPRRISIALTPAQPESGLLAEAVKVKPLRWKGPDSSGEYHSLDGLWGYLIRAGNNNGFWMTETGGYFPTVEAAKAAAQADYEQRIRSVLSAPALEAQTQEKVVVTPGIAARVLYENWSGLTSLPSPARELASQGHFFSALRLLFEPDADLTKPPKATSSRDDIHPDDFAVERFATAMKAKLAKKRDEGRSGWEDKDDCSQLFLSQLLREHVEKGDPVDVGNLAMMLHQRDERISSLLETLQGE